jgi:hyperosmotically inducible protein
MHRQTVFLGLLFVALLAPRPAAGQMADADLANRAAEAVRGYSGFSIFDDVNIAVADRAVTLTGRVTMPFKRDEIGSRVKRIDGVRSVENEIQVLPASNFDAQLRVRVAQAIYSHPAFWQYASMACPPIHIIVERGHVTLTGRVNNQVERMLAFTLAQVDGALGVKNELKLDGR